MPRMQMSVGQYMDALTYEKPYLESMGRLVRCWAHIEMVLDAQVCLLDGLSYEEARSKVSRGSANKRWDRLFPNRPNPRDRSSEAAQLFYSDDSRLFRQIEFVSKVRNMVCHAESRDERVAKLDRYADGRTVARGVDTRRRMNPKDPKSKGHSEYAAAIYMLLEGVQHEPMLRGGVPLLCFAYYAEAAENLLAELYGRLVELKKAI